MFREREPFERSDVPKAGPLRTILSLVALAAVIGGLYFLITTLWNQVQLEEHLSDSGLTNAVSGQKGPASISGYSASEDMFQSVLVLTASSLDEGAGLEAAELLVIDVSTRTGTLVSVPTDLTVVTAEGYPTLAQLYQESGASACVSAMSNATNIQLSHAIVSTGDVWDQVADLGGVGVNWIVMRGSHLLEAMYTDMSSQDLTDLAELVQSIGVSNLTRVDCPTYPEGSWDENGSWVSNGSGRFYVYQPELGVATGVLVSY